MDNFNLRKYLAENKLLKEEKTFNVYNDDGEPVLVNLNKSTLSQEKLIRWEMPNITEPETSEEAQEIANEIMQLNSVEDVKQYYGYKRGWFNSSLKNLVGDAMVVYSSLSENKLIKENSEYFHKGADGAQTIIVPDDLGEVDSDEFYNQLEGLSDGQMSEMDFEINKEYEVYMGGDDIIFKLVKQGNDLIIDKNSIKIE